MSTFDKVVSLAKRRGFFWPAYEIYGGVKGFLCYGPLGVKLLENIKRAWRDFFVRKLDLLEIDSPVIAPARVFEASGHVEHFKDVMVECLRCGGKFRADQLVEEQTGIRAEGYPPSKIGEIIKEKEVRCPSCGGELGEPKYFMTMFRTTIGPYSDKIGYGRPETAQGMFVEYPRLYSLARKKVPFGVAQIGKVLRNEISPRQGPIRLREFTIMEFEFFIDPEDPSCPHLDEVRGVELNLWPAELKRKGEEPTKLSVKEALEKGFIVNEWLAYFMALSQEFLTSMGIPPEEQLFDEKLPGERAHYSEQTYDQEVKIEPWGWVELAGHSYRTDYDLKRHSMKSGADMSFFKPYPEPRIRVRRIAHPLPSKIKAAYPERAGFIMQKLATMDPERVAKELDAQGFVQVDDLRLSREFFRVEEKEEKETGKKIIPHVVEPSFGADRILLAVLMHAYSEKDGRVVLKLPRKLAPIQVAVFPLVSRDGLPEKALELYKRLKEKFWAIYEETGSIGKRYAKADEIGIPICVTIDYQTLKDNTVTLRDRDTWKQVRVRIEELEDKLEAYLAGKRLKELGELI